jgi:hypothetical protein
LITAWGRIRPKASLTAAASRASAMTGSAPISFNDADPGDRASANTSCWFALRRRTSGRPIAPLAPAIRILIALPFQLEPTEDDIEAATTLLANLDIGLNQIAHCLGVSPATFYRYGPAARSWNIPSAADFTGTRPTASVFPLLREATDDFAQGLQL